MFFSSSILGRVLTPVAIVTILAIVAGFMLLPDTSSAITVSAAVIVQLIVTGLMIKLVLGTRLSNMSDYLDKVVSTETAPSSPLQDTGSDELSYISNRLDNFIEELRDVIEQVRGDNQNVRSGSEEQAGKMSSSVAQLRTCTHETENMAESIDQVAATSHTLADNANRISETIHQVAESLDEGSSAAYSNQQSMTELVNNVESMSDNVARLQNESAQIGSVLDVIGGIAEQTNLLALNAAIEAARAGEQGRGFAVVADEVRALAHRTQDSTGEIQTMVEDLQAKAQSAVEAMEVGRNLSNSSLEQSQALEEIFQKVRSVVTEVNELASQIANGTNTQNAATDSISSRIVGVAEQSKEVCANLEIISEKAHDQQEMSRQVDTILNRICI